MVDGLLPVFISLLSLLPSPAKFNLLFTDYIDAITFRNVIKAIDTLQLHKVFTEWISNVVEHLTGVVALDGKQARRTKDAKKKPLHVVSTPFAESFLVLGQLACE